MQGYGDHKVTDPFKDEDKWLWLTKRQLFMLVPVVLLCWGIIKQTFQWGILPVGIIISVLLLIMVGVIMLVKVPPEKYLFGSGVHLEVILMRRIKKILPWNKKIYTKHCKNDYKEW